MIICAVLVGGGPAARRRLAALLTGTGRVEVVDEAEDAGAGLRLCARPGVDVAFLDTRLPGSASLTLAAALARLPDPPLLVFVSDSPAAAVAAFQVHAAGFLLEPLAAGRVEEAVRYLEQRLHERRAVRGLPVTPLTGELLPVRDRDRDVARLLARSEIVAVLRHERRTWVHTAEDEYPSPFAVSQLAAWLGGAPFLRAARGAVVNIEAVAEIIHYGDRLYRLRLRDRRGTVVQVSRSGARLLLALLPSRR